MSNSTGAPTGRYYEWLQEPAKQAQIQRELPARILAACQLKGAWTSSGCPRIAEGSQFSYQHFHEYEDLYHEIVTRVAKNAQGRGILPHVLVEALSAVQRLPFHEVMKLASMHGVFSVLMPDAVLVMDVMHS